MTILPKNITHEDKGSWHFTSSENNTLHGIQHAGGRRAAREQDLDCVGGMKLIQRNH